MRRGRSDRAFTLIDLLLTVVITIVLLGVVAVATTPRPRSAIRQLKDATQVRAVVQGFTVWSQSNKGRYPLPSLLDAQNATTPEVGAAKDHTANILSVLIWNGNISPEITVSPAEANYTIVVDTDYQYSNPKAAANPAAALWDPAFSADFTTPSSSGNVSYAHIPPSGARLAQWAETVSTTGAVFGNRGPLVSGVAYPAAGSAAPAFDAASNTLLIHGGRTTWEGNIGYNDGHVNFETSMAPGFTFADAVGAKRPDTLFCDEPNDAAGTNAFLGVFTGAGPTPAGFKAIWD